MPRSVFKWQRHLNMYHYNDIASRDGGGWGHAFRINGGRHHGWWSASTYYDSRIARTLAEAKRFVEKRVRRVR